MPDKINEAPDRLIIGGKRVLLKYAPNQKSACQNCAFHTDDIEHCSLRETDYFGVVCPCERFGNFSSYPYFVLDNSNTKEFTIPDRIYIYSNAGGNSYSIFPTENIADKKFEIEYIRADKVMEILDNKIAELEKEIKESDENCQILTLDDASTRQCALIGIKKEIEALWSNKRLSELWLHSRY